MSVDFVEMWNKCTSSISKEIDENIFLTWIEPIKPKSLINGVLEIQVPNTFFYEWVGGHYSLLIEKKVKEFIGKDVTIKYSIEEEEVIKEEKIKNETIDSKISDNITFIKNHFPYIKDISGLNKKYTFENFIEGSNNKFARSCALSIALKPNNNDLFNPFFIYGDVGLGKTHLLQAIGNKIKEEDESKFVVYTQVTVFINQFIKSILQNNSSQDFAKFYLSVDVLLLDDVQFLKDKTRTQEMLFHILNHLTNYGKQVVFTSDRPPSELTGIHSRLTSRFKSRLIADITMPDYEDRLAILRSKIPDTVYIDDSLIEFIAQRVKSNIRELIGTMYNAIAKTSSENNLSINEVQNIINDICNNDVEVDRISFFVAEYCKISIDDILGKSREKDIALARKLAMYFSQKYTKCSLKTIGKLIGGRDHSTVTHAIKSINELVKKEKDLRNTVRNINQAIKRNLNYSKTHNNIDYPQKT